MCYHGNDMPYDISASSLPSVPSHGEVSGPVEKVVWDAHEAIVFLFRKLGGALPSGHESQFRRLGEFARYFSQVPDCSVGSDIYQAAHIERKRLGSITLDPGHLSQILRAAFAVDRERGGG